MRCAFIETCSLCRVIGGQCLIRYYRHEFPEIIYDDNGVFLYALLMFVLSPFVALLSKTRLTWHV